MTIDDIRKMAEEANDLQNRAVHSPNRSRALEAEKELEAHCIDSPLPNACLALVEYYEAVEADYAAHAEEVEQGTVLTTERSDALWDRIEAAKERFAELGTKGGDDDAD